MDPRTRSSSLRSASGSRRGPVLGFFLGTLFGLACAAAPAAAQACEEDRDTLCLNEGRFAVDVSWETPAGETGVGTAVPVTDDSGLFYFFGPDNLEMLVKVLDGCGFNQRYWVFFAATTNVAFELAVRDSATGETSSYRNPQGRAADAITDTAAFATCSVAAQSAGSRTADLVRTAEPVRPTPRAARPPALALDGVLATECVPGPSVACLAGGRFRVAIDWLDRTGNGGPALQTPIASSGDSTLFYFTNPQNLEVLLKVLDACAFADRFWVFFAATTNLQFEVRVTDTLVGETRTYVNPQGQAANAVTDTMAFATCDGDGSPPDVELAPQPGRRVARDLPVEGGAVSAEGADGTVYTVSFPPGSLPRAETITLTPATATTDRLEGVAASVLLEPTGLRLLEPATLRIELPGTTETADLVGFRVDSGGRDFALTTATIDAATVTLDLTHFSGAGVGAFDLELEPIPPCPLSEVPAPSVSTPEARARHRIVVLTRGLIEECIEDSVLVAGQILAEIFQDWYAEGVLPRLEYARAQPTYGFDLALAELNAWLGALRSEPLAERFAVTAQPLLPFDCPEGPCLNLGQAANRSARDLIRSLRELVVQADARCILGGINDDAETLEAIDLGHYLTASGDPSFQAAEGIWDAAPDPLTALKSCGLEELRWEVGLDGPGDPKSRGERLYLLAGTTEIIEITGRNRFDEPVPLGRPPRAFREVEVFEVGGGVDVDVVDVPNGQIQIQAKQAGDTELDALTVFPRSQEVLLIAEAPVRVIDLDGRWLITTTFTDNDCEPPAPLPPPEFATVTVESFSLRVELDQSFDMPLEGPLLLGEVIEPPAFQIGPASSESSQFCQQFSADVCAAIGGCAEDITAAAAISCRESQQQDGDIQEDGVTMEGRSGFRVELVYDLFTEESDGPARIEGTCEGINEIQATKQ